MNTSGHLVLNRGLVLIGFRTTGLIIFTELNQNRQFSGRGREGFRGIVHAVVVQLPVTHHKPHDDASQYCQYIANSKNRPASKHRMTQIPRVSHWRLLSCHHGNTGNGDKRNICVRALVFSLADCRPHRKAEIHRRYDVRLDDAFRCVHGVSDVPCLVAKARAA